ncbi:hypothetical protein N7509_000249 [Penicillium cosmopolitanum]|uniref:Zn(2)-C6 fungal-type domain-containing protein n=1 Tax=Penicillium cosmopolitanum TaxID=1131564 RepID=A0A9W9WAE1_9EURO|nr:uncharacterized protein N7509_000249 [Penicillium cosmopolitanum]KAJ5413622.1 hypothetical protein N7509_000249 [Penicillium cosmopolitanum]
MDPKTPRLNGRATRSSLACLDCRSRHLKCDGKRPCCSRCTEVGKQCQYAPSRRGGLDRAALAERRKRIAAAANTTEIEEFSPQYPTDLQLAQGVGLSQFPEAGTFNGHRLLDGFRTGDATSGTSSPLATQVSPCSLSNDVLINSYFRNFHTFHPFLPPQNHLMRLYQDQSKQDTLMPLIAIIRLVGYIYSARRWSDLLKDYAESCFSQVSSTDPIMVQCRLLYSVALFWYDYKAEARRQMDQATRLAIDLQMNCQEFSTTQGAGDLILQECWRRTWWTLYILDAYYAGTQGTTNFQVVDIESTVGLPCEEKEYESGDIPEPKTIQDWENREFAPDNFEFSSFAYLIGAVRCTAFAVSMAPKIAMKEDSMLVIQTADSILNGWLLLLPESRKQVMSKTGEVNELLFQANLLIHVTAICLHRPFSNLRFNPVEDVSSCAREPPPDNPRTDLINVHAVGEGQRRMRSEADTLSENLDMLPYLGSIDDLRGWYDFGYLNQNILCDMSNPSSFPWRNDN